MNETVLIVDDSLTVRMDLAEAFEGASFRVVQCATAAEARAAMTAGTVAVVVLDVLLPDANGVDLLRELRSAPDGAALPVLMLSAEAEVRDRIRGLQTGADEYVGKPYDRGYVVARARELLRIRRAGTASERASVLVIDDSATFRHELCAALEAAGYAVMTAEHGEEGLRIAADRRPSAVIVDGVMPGIDGATVIRRLRLDAALRDVPCLLLTASEGSGAELRALDAGADAFVRKEEHLDVILARFAAIVRGAATTKGDRSKSLLGPKRILAVDDSPSYLHVIETALRGEGYDVVLACSGEEAIDLLAVQPVDCILLDVMMPGLSGQETCKRIKAAPVVRNVPLIMLTALEDREAMFEGLAAGADDFIAKSSELEVLKARIRAQLRRKMFEDENRLVREQLMQKEVEAAEARAARELAETRAALVGELERKNEELEAFSYSVSHDLRAPLRSIDGFSQALLEDYSDAIDAKGQDYLRRVRAAAQRMGELIDDLLSLSRVGRAELRPTRVDLTKLARAVIHELGRRDAGRDVRVEIEDGLWVVTDAGLLKIVLENLIGNAWKFTSKIAQARIEFRSNGLLRDAVYCVRDNGAGFDMRHADRLFGAFQRLHSTTDFAGSGIGLATVHRIVDRLGGRVWAEAGVGEGATFFFTLGGSSGGVQ